LVHGLWRLADWQMHSAELAGLIESCLSCGITTFDHADVYGDYRSETLFGAALAESRIDRASVQLVTKCGIKLLSANRPAHRAKSCDTSREHLIASVENSRRYLRTEYIDLLLIHRPNPLLEPGQVNEAFVALREAGKVRHFGVSNFLPSQFAMLSAQLDVPLVTNQIEYSPLYLEPQADGTIDLCLRLGIRPMAWSPFGGGRLFTDESVQADLLRETLATVGHELGGASIDQVVLAWILRHPAGFVPILGSGKVERIISAAASLDLVLTNDQWFEIRRAATGQDVA
jgi:predicted oxidoreductase